MLNDDRLQLIRYGEPSDPCNYYRVVDNNLELNLLLATPPSADVKYEVFLKNSNTPIRQSIGGLIIFTTPTPYVLGKYEKTGKLSIPLTFIEAFGTGTLKLKRSVGGCIVTGSVYSCELNKFYLPETMIIVYEKNYITYERNYSIYTINELCHDSIDGRAIVQIEVPRDDNNELSLKIGDVTSTRQDYK